jgi:hypothetical protein
MLRCSARWTLKEDSLRDRKKKSLREKLNKLKQILQILLALLGNLDRFVKFLPKGTKIKKDPANLRGL